MPGTDKASASGGFTLVEILIALAILGILIVMSVSTFQGMNEKYRVEAETKQLYTDMMEARGRAMQRNRVHFVRLSVGGNVYGAFEDTNTPPDGNGVFDNAADTRIANAVMTHAIATNLPVAGGVASFEFNRNGIASAVGYIQLSSTVQADYDCITIVPTRIKMGQFNGGNCVEK